MASVAIHDDMFTADVIADPYRYYGQLREEDPVHWNETYELWVITRHDDVVWMTWHYELFSSAWPLGRACITASGQPWRG